MTGSQEHRLAPVVMWHASPAKIPGHTCGKSATSVGNYNCICSRAGCFRGDVTAWLLTVKCLPGARLEMPGDGPQGCSMTACQYWSVPQQCTAAPQCVVCSYHKGPWSEATLKATC